MLNEEVNVHHSLLVLTYRDESLLDVWKSRGSCNKPNENL